MLKIQIVEPRNFTVEATVGFVPSRGDNLVFDGEDVRFTVIDVTCLADANVDGVQAIVKVVR